jgi:hypothetical protein
VEVVGREGSPSGVEASAMQRKVVFQLVLDQGREERREAR